MKKLFLLSTACAGLLWTGSAFSAPVATATPKEAASLNSGATQSDVIGSKEAPGVFNIVPWKEKKTTLQKREVNTSILRETLQPLDRDVLRREIEFHRNTDQP